MASYIVEDFAAIHARMLGIEAAEGAEPSGQDALAPPEAPQKAGQARPVDFQTWLMGGGLWALS